MDKPRILFIDHSFHEKTRSTEFIISILRKNFDVDIFWDDSWRGGRRPPLDLINGYAHVFFWQVILPLYQLKKITAKMIWAPMYDGVSLLDIYWRSLSCLPLKILSFSDVLYKKCQHFDITTLSLQYYLPPEFQGTDPAKKLSFLFWYRGGVKFKDFKKILNPDDVGRLIYRCAPDPFVKRETISDEDIKKYKIEIVDDSEVDSRKSYLQLLGAVDVFVAPRKKEGIGMSFLEAMSMGKVVVAYDDGTMNEYIRNGQNGYLFASEKRYIDLSNFAAILRNSKISVENGWKKWEQKKSKIANFIIEKGPERSKKITAEFLFYSFFEWLGRELIRIKIFFKK